MKRYIIEEKGSEGSCYGCLYDKHESCVDYRIAPCIKRRENGSKEIVIFVLVKEEEIK